MRCSCGIRRCLGEDDIATRATNQDVYSSRFTLLGGAKDPRRRTRDCGRKFGFFTSFRMTDLVDREGLKTLAENLAESEFCSGNFSADASGNSSEPVMRSARTGSF